MGKALDYRSLGHGLGCKALDYRSLGYVLGVRHWTTQITGSWGLGVRHWTTDHWVMV